VIIRRREVDSPNDLVGVEHDILRRVYSARGIRSSSEVDRSLKSLLPPTQLPDIDIASKRLADAIQQQQSILIVGDFDADGATSVALCMIILQQMGAEKINYLVPNRFDFGYGLSPEIVELAEQFEPDVLVTVDNGVSSVAGVALANTKNIDVIITDHHLVGVDRPAAYAIVNPNLPESTFASKSMAGVGVAYYLMGAVRRELQSRDWFGDHREVPNMAAHLDLVALGTVADVVPLDRNNRILVHQGLQRIRAGHCKPGIKAIAAIGKRQLQTLSAQDLGFALGPRLNAAGRLKDMAIGIKCLMTSDLAEAKRLATALDELNKTRRRLEQDMVSDAEIVIAQAQADTDKVGLAVYHASFHQGVVGIVAGRIREKFNKPAIVFADAGDVAPDELKGSARSIAGLHIRDVLDQVATSHPGLLLKFGGHAMAAGLSIKRVHLQRFGVIFDKAVREQVDEEMLQANLLTDGELSAADLSIDTANVISSGGPWGSGFAEPSFVGDFDLVSQRVVGDIHLKLVVKLDARVVDAIAFRQPPLASNVKRVRLVYKVSANDYGEWPTVQLMVEYIEALP